VLIGSGRLRHVIELVGRLNQVGSELAHLFGRQFVAVVDVDVQRLSDRAVSGLQRR
jgi:hypothetical protein